ncbi:MAG: lysophospholipid acyltransferase family protein [Saprospiraceae bacterium]
MNWRKWLFLLIVLPIARLPERLRYLLSDTLAWVLRSVVKYRRKVVEDNIAIAFPEKPAEERRDILNKFYTNFTDVALEQTWLLTATKEQLLAKSTLVNPEVVAKFAKEGRPVMLAAGHHNNYEIAVASIAMQMPMPLALIYAPVANPYFDERVRVTRGRFGLNLWPRGEASRRAKEWSEQYDSFSIGFAFDQSPHGAKRKYWMPFFGRPTAMATGLESYSRKYNAAVVYVSVERVRRGHYTMTMQEVTPDANAEPDGAILAKANAMLEEVLRKDPVGWLWSHRRWKLDIEKHRIDRDTVIEDPFS